MFKVFIAADIEGTSGYVDWPERQPEDDLRREEMIAEVNAAVEGALSGGATDIVVSDSSHEKAKYFTTNGRDRRHCQRTKRLRWMDTVQECNAAFYRFSCQWEQRSVLPIL